MPWPRTQKQESRERILESAVELFSRHGYDKVSIGDLMKRARLTHGAFYSHFASKQALYAEAVTAAARESALAKLLPDESLQEIDLDRLLGAYLSTGHVKQEHPPCPLAFLATDIANREADVRAAYTRVFKRLVALIGKGLPESDPDRRDRARALAAMMIGGVAVSRALNDDRATDALLAACRRFGSELIAGTECT